MPALPAVIRVIREICGESGFIFNPKTKLISALTECGRPGRSNVG